MPTIEAQLQTLLGNLVSGRCYPIVNTSAAIVSPYITYQLIHAEMRLVTSNTDKPENSRFQIDVWATTYGAAKTLAESVKTAMNSAAFSNVPIMFQDLYEEVSKEYRVVLEYYIWP